MAAASDESGSCACGAKHEGSDKDKNRRAFLTATAGIIGTAGAAAALWLLIDPGSPAADATPPATTDVDVSQLQEGQSMTVAWRGKPVFIRHRTAPEIAEARAVDIATLRDPQSDRERVKQSVIGGQEAPQWLVVVGICTHLHCVPLGQKPSDPRGDFDGWFCPCHGSQYDSAARIRKGPAPSNMAVPPYQFIDATHIRIG